MLLESITARPGVPTPGLVVCGVAADFAPANVWEQHKVTACQATRRGDWNYMFYIGFQDGDHARIGLARSRDGIGGCLCTLMLEVYYRILSTGAAGHGDS